MHILHLHTWNGGDIIKPGFWVALLIVLAIALYTLPSFGGIENQSSFKENAIFGADLNANSHVLEVNAASSLTTLSYYYQKVPVYKSKKVATYTYKYVKVRSKKKVYYKKVRVRTYRYVKVVSYYKIVKYNVSTAKTTKYYGPNSYSVNSDKVSATGAYCSCGWSDGYYRHGTNIFLNYCPACHRYGTLSVEIGSGSHNPEGMFYCTRCDADYCLVHGKIHVSGSSVKLTSAPATNPVPNPPTNQPTNPPTNQPSNPDENSTTNDTPNSSPQC